MNEPQLLPLAQAGLALGFCVMPPKEDGSKKPVGFWEEYEHRLPTAAEIQRWFPPSRQGIGVIAGAVSGNLEVLDFDHWDIYQAFLARAHEHGIDAILDRIRAGYEEQTPKPGAHLLWRCSTIEGNSKLAHAEDSTTLIETRGEGGFCILAPSHGTVHESGKPYRLLHGGWDSIVTITPEERDAILTLCRSFDKAPPRPEYVPSANPSPHSGTRPGDLFASATSWRDILEPHGWHWVQRVGEVDHWRRPGKERNTSATTNYAGSDCFYCFSSSTIFDTNHGYGKFSVYALLNHNGNYAEAAEALYRKGFHEKKEKFPRVLTTGFSNGTGPQHAIGNQPATSLIPYHLTEVGNAERLYARYGANIHWIQDWKKWAAWEPPKWDTDGGLTVVRYAKQTIRALYREAGELTTEAAENDNDPKRQEQAKIATATIRHALNSEADKKINAMISLVREQVAMDPAIFDGNPWLLNCTNGTIDLKTGQLGPHRREDYLTKITPLAFDPDASCTQWEDFLEVIFAGNQELITWIQKAIGYTLTGSVQEQVFFLCHGSGSNGKSTFLYQLASLTGNYGMDTPFSTFQPQKSETIRNDLAALRGSRFVSAIESNAGSRFSDNVMKAMTGGTDRLTARFLHGEFFSFAPTFKVWLASNHRPAIKDTTHAMWRRVCLIPFTVTIADEDQDQLLGEKLKAELPGILAWAVRGCVRWCEEGLKPFPSIVQAATQDYREESDQVAEFIEEECVKQKEMSIPSSLLYAAFCRWSEMQGEKRPMSINAFGASLTEKGYKVDRSSVTGRKVRRGLGLRIVDEQA